jgi:hypothetical protein
MRKLQQLCTAVVLTLMLTTGAFAGIIETPKAPPPPPASSSATSPGEIPIPGDMPINSASSDSVELIALNLLQSVLSVF